MANSNKEIYTAYMREYMLKRYNTRRALAFSILGDSCVKCGSKENLEFDHIDSTTKFKTIAKVWSYSLTRFIDEINKCQVLCKECHHLKSLECKDYNQIPHWPS